jgi:hypothetical protein
MCAKINEGISAENVCNFHRISKELAVSGNRKSVRTQNAVDESI